MKQNVFSLVNVTKVAAKAAMVSLTACVLTLTSCNGEQEINLPSNAKALLVSAIDSTMTLGKTQAWWSGSATTAETVLIDGNGSLIYDGMPKVYVPQLGLPTEVTANGDVFTSSDGNVFNRSFNWSSTTGVNGTSTPNWERTVILAQLNDSTELCEAQFKESWSVWTSLLPSTYESSKNGDEIIRVLYQRVVKPEAPVEPITYRKSLTLDFEDAANGEAYGDMLVEKVQGSTILDSWDCFGIMAKWGKYNPQVSNQSVNSFDFTSHDLLGETKDLEADLPGLGKGKTFTRKNVRHTAETFEVRFQSNPDADGNTVRPIRGQIDVWVYEYVFVNPEDNHKETFTVEVEVVSTKSEVNPNTNAYERTIEVRINGQVVDVQNGKVQLTIG
jgi:hypothetical protein